jgi:hypothetical protein
MNNYRYLTSAMTNPQLIFYRVALIVTLIYIFIVLHIGKEKLKK